MDDAQKRRQELLSQTRKIYSDKNKVPVVHPRYGNFNLGTSENANNISDGKVNYFKLRLTIALILFVLYAGIEYTGIEIGEYSSQEVIEVISQSIDIQEVWNSW